MRNARLMVLLAGFGFAMSASGADLTLRGSDSTRHIVQALAEGFTKETGVKVVVEGGGSSAGVKAAMDGTVPLAFLSRELHVSEKEAGLQEHPYALDAVAVIANGNNPVEGVTKDELKTFFTASDAKWKDGLPVVAFTRNTDSGTREIVQEVVLGKDVAFSPKVAIKHNVAMLESVAKIRTAVGYTSLADSTAKGVKAIAVDGVAANEKTVRDKSYPLARALVFATKGAAQGDAKRFIDFATGDAGTKIVEAQGCFACKAEVKAQADAAKPEASK